MNRILLRYELLGLLRDTRTLVLSVVLPIILLPILLFTLHRFGEQRFGRGANDDFSYGGVPPQSGLEVVANQAFKGTAFKEVLVQNNEEGLADGALDVLLRVGQPEKKDEDLLEDIELAFPSLATLAGTEKSGRPVIELLYRGDRDRSVRAYLAAQEQLRDYRDRLLDEYLAGEKVQLGWEVEERDVSSAQERNARRYGPALSSFMVLILLGGGSVAALDSLAGEKERGTLTTLFLSSLPREEILWSKFSAVALISVAVAVIQMANLGFYALIGWMKIPLAAGVGHGALILGSLVILFLAEALFTASLLLHISARSGSFKEAQLFFFPAFLIAFALSLAGMMPGLAAGSLVSLVPLAGPGVLIPELLASRGHPLVLLLQVLVHVLGAWLLMRSTLAYVAREDYMGGQPPAVGSALQFEQFSQRALPFYAFLGAALMVVPANFAGLSTLAGQGFFNQVILFGLGPLLLLRLFGQKPSRAIPLKMVSPRILLCCLLLVPLAQVSATGLSHLLGPLLPPPVKALEEMMKFLDLENTPPWQVYLFIGILPGIFEEIAFRGVLLHALHRRFGPWALAAVVAVVFGLFHLTFYRVFPTAFIGFFLGVLTLATGSVLPSILVHMGNNSLAVFALMRGWDFENLGTLTYLSSFLGLLGATALVCRWGGGYPGTRWYRGRPATTPE